MKRILYFSWLKCQECGNIIKDHFQERKPQSDQVFTCSRCNEEKRLYKYDRINTIVDDREKAHLLRLTPYENMPVSLIAVGTIMISKFKRRESLFSTSK